MDSKINGVAVVILPPGLSKEEVQVLFSSILGKLEAIHPEYKQNGGFLTILEPNDLFRVVNLQILYTLRQSSYVLTMVLKT